MDEIRKKIIVNEIHYWKNNKMLPEQYCNYLLALYTEGTDSDETDEVTTKTRGKIRLHYFAVIPLVLLALFVIYFTALPIGMQIAILSVLVLIGLGFSIYFSKKGLLFQVPLIASALLALLGSVELTSRALPHNHLALYIVIVINCCLWLLAGKTLKLLYFSISGVLGIIIIIISIFI